jgi:hypothetical protein
MLLLQLVEKLTKRFLEHPTTEISYSKVPCFSCQLTATSVSKSHHMVLQGEQQLLECIKGDAIKLAQDLQPAFELLQVCMVIARML